MTAMAEQAAPGGAPARRRARRQGFYPDVLRHLDAAGIPFLVGGAFAFARVTGIRTHTKDLDLFVRRCDLDRALAALAARGYRTEVPYPHWLAKVWSGDEVIDVIFNSGNGESPVDDEWLAHGVAATVLGVEVRLCPVEEMIWTKAFIMERERYDGSDVAHLICAHARRIDWPRLVRRFGPNLPVLVSHLILFCFIYPGECGRLPSGLLDDLIERLRSTPTPDGAARLCRGGLLSRTQYLVDLGEWGYADARRQPRGRLSGEELAIWTAAAEVQRPVADVEHGPPGEALEESDRQDSMPQAWEGSRQR